MNGPLQIRRDPPADGPSQMAADAALMDEVGPDRPAILRFYTWDPPTLSLGRFQSPDDAPDLPMVLRATGGGAIFHHANSLTFALALCRQTHAWAADPLRLYASVNRLWTTAFDALAVPVRERREAREAEPDPPFLCFDRRERTDLVVGVGDEVRKVLGSAQRRAEGAILIHGTLSRSAGALAERAAPLDEIAQRPISEDAVVRAVRQAAARAGFELE